MTTIPHDELNRWLAAEAANDAAEAEAGFDALFASVPRLEPQGGFTERVLWAIDPDPAPRFVPAGWGWKAMTAAALAMAAVAAGLLPLVRWLPIGLPTLGTVLKGGARGLAWVAEWLDAGLAMWGFLATIGEAFGVAAATPEVGTALVMSALIGAMALYELNHLLAIERRPST